MGQLTWRAVQLAFWADAAMIAAHLLSGRTAAFNLDGEGNVPTWWSATKLLCVGLLAFAVARAERDVRPAVPHTWMWNGLGALFVALSLDESASLHERLARQVMAAGFGGNLRQTLLGGDEAKDGFVWVILFAPIAVVVFTYLATFAWTRRHRLRRLVWVGVAGAGCYASAMLLEPLGIYFTPAMADWGEAEVERYQSLTLVEESLELFGTSFFLIVTLRYLLQCRADEASGAEPAPTNLDDAVGSPVDSARE